MSDKINVEDILKKHTSINSEESWGRNGKFEITNYKAAIKEALEAAIDKCAENVNFEQVDSVEVENKEGKHIPTVLISIDLNSILKVKQMIDYE